jgi:hypothetical protein
MCASIGRTLAGVVTLFAALLCLGCGKDKVTQPPVYDDTSLHAADSVLARVLLDELGSEPQRPSDVDFTAPYNLYNAAVADPNLSAAARLRARFGAAVLGMLILSTDSEVNAAFDEWSQYLADRVPFEVVPAPSGPLGIPTGLTSPRRALRLPFDVVPLSLVAQTRAPLGTLDPQISRVQAILRERVLPRLSEAIAHLNVIGADPSFQFIVTPDMQGDPDADPVEIDRTDALALRAACKLLASACHVAVAYELGFPAYDRASLLAAIQPGSGWLALLPDGGSQMSLARTDILGSLNDVEATIGSLLDERDNQDDDVIRVGPGALERASLDSVTARLGQVRQALDGGFTLTADWDGRAATPEVPLRVNLRPMFDTPVQDWKQLLPAYAGSAQERPFNRSWVYDYVSDSTTFTVSNARYYSGGFSMRVSASDLVESYFGDTEIVNALRPIVQTRYSYVSSQPGWGGDFDGSSSFYGELPVGATSVSTIVWEYYSVASRFVYVPVITWNATQFSEWAWPDPTMNGLLPGITTTDQLLTTFGFDPTTWRRELVLDWTGSGSNLGSAPRRTASFGGYRVSGLSSARRLPSRVR